MTAASGADREPFIKRFERENPEAMTRARAEVAAAASGADQPTLRDQLERRLESAGMSRQGARELTDQVLPLIEADRERAVANALAARVLRDIDYAVEREVST